MNRAKLFVLSACKAAGLFGLARRLCRRRLRILAYHGFELDDESAFRPKLFMKPATFERRLEKIRDHGFRVLPLDEAFDRMRDGTLPEDAVAITVDDGFHGFHRQAVPVLARFGFPATVYMTTYYVRHPDPIFRLVVQYMFWKAGARSLRLDGVPWSDDAVVDLADAARAHATMWRCIEFGEGLADEGERREICRTLGSLLGVPYDGIVRSRILALMQPEELRTLAAAGIAVELHTHRHTFPRDDPDAARREIADNRAALSEWLGGGERRHFCYPSGIWDAAQWSWLDAMNVKSSTTCDPGLNDPGTPRHALFRFLDSEQVHPLQFEAALAGFPDAFLRRRRSPPREESR